MRHIYNKVCLSTMTALFITLIMGGCRIEPPLHLPDDPDVDIEWAKIELELDILWKYQLYVDSLSGEIYDSTYNWRDEWYYGWDARDDSIFGKWTLLDPEVYNIRRYYTGVDGTIAHTQPYEHQVDEPRLLTSFRYGYYDILAWNEVTTLDGVQSLHFDETSTFDYVRAYTNQSTARSRYNARHAYSFYQPEFLYGGYLEKLFISHDPADYDYYDPQENIYYKKVKMLLEPRTYIYLVQVILHNNRGRISAVDGSANLSGMAYETNLNTGHTTDDDVSVTYNVRLKNGIARYNESVDIIGGRLFTFGIHDTYPYRSNPVEAREKGKKYIDMNIAFNNGMDSTFVFDVSEQVNRRYKGGIITIELDVDTINIPRRSGGSGFDAVVEDFDEVTHEFDVGGGTKK